MFFFLNDINSFTKINRVLFRKKKKAYCSYRNYVYTQHMDREIDRTESKHTFQQLFNDISHKNVKRNYRPLSKELILNTEFAVNVKHNRKLFGFIFIQGRTVKTSHCVNRIYFIRIRFHSFITIISLGHGFIYTKSIRVYHILCSKSRENKR